jgi:hypothetical protein
MKNIDIYSMNDNGISLMNIKPANIKRNWMDKTGGTAYRCIPLNIANEYGWVCHSPSTFTATWNGGQSQDSITIVDHGDGPKNFCKSHFGNGIITLPPDFIVQTPKNVSIYVRGLTNSGYENIHPLDAIVETDWLPFTFTMNYKFLSPGSVTFKKGDPLFMFFPIERNFIESFTIEQKTLSSNLELKDKYQKYGESRKEHLKKENQKPQKFYVSGTIVDEKALVDNHKIKLKLENVKNISSEEI